jgi:hypothetical protein
MLLLTFSLINQYLVAYHKATKNGADLGSFTRKARESIL